MINTNLHPTSHRFEVIANLRFRLFTLLFSTLIWGEPLKSGPQSLASKNYKHCSIVWCSFTDDYFVLSQFIHLTDGRTDRQMSTARPCICIRSRTVKIQRRWQFTDGWLPTVLHIWNRSLLHTVYSVITVFSYYIVLLLCVNQCNRWAQRTVVIGASQCAHQQRQIETFWKHGM